MALLLPVVASGVSGFIAGYMLQYYPKSAEVVNQSSSDDKKDRADKKDIISAIYEMKELSPRKELNAALTGFDKTILQKPKSIKKPASPVIALLLQLLVSYSV